MTPQSQRLVGLRDAKRTYDSVVATVSELEEAGELSPAAAAQEKRLALEIYDNAKRSFKGGGGSPLFPTHSRGPNEQLPARPLHANIRHWVNDDDSLDSHPGSFRIRKPRYASKGVKPSWTSAEDLQRGKSAETDPRSASRQQGQPPEKTHRTQKETLIPEVLTVGSDNEDSSAAPGGPPHGGSRGFEDKHATRSNPHSSASGTSNTNASVQRQPHGLAAESRQNDRAPQGTWAESISAAHSRKPTAETSRETDAPHVLKLHSKPPGSPDEVSDHDLEAEDTFPSVNAEIFDFMGASRGVPADPPSSLSAADELVLAHERPREKKKTADPTLSLEPSSRQQRSVWRRDRDTVDRKMIVANLWTAFFANAGMLFAIATNEMIFQNVSPHDPVVNYLKIANSVCTVLSICFLYHSYWLKTLFNRVVTHLRRGVQLDVNVSFVEVLALKFFWAELEVPANALKNFSVHRLETLMAVWNTLRIYLIVRCWTDASLAQLPKRHTVATHASIDIGTSFAFKRVFSSWQAVTHISQAWAIMLLVSGYWFRAAEFTACQLSTTLDPRCQERSARFWSLDGVTEFEKVNDLYMQNAVWVMFITSCTIGYGDIIPTTLFSRACAAVVALGGIVLAALLTASLENALHWSPAELSALLILEREKARVELLQQAATLISLWWRKRKGRRLSRKQRAIDPLTFLLKFKAVQKKARVDTEDLAADSAKIDATANRIKYIKNSVTALVQNAYAEEDALEDFHGSNEAEKRKRINELKVKILIHNSSEFSNRMLDRMKMIATSGRVLSPGHDDRKDREEARKQRSVQVARKMIEQMGRSSWGNLDWKRNRGMIDHKLISLNQTVSILSLAGTMLAIFANEQVIRDVSPDDMSIDLAKGGNSIVSMFLIFLIYRFYSLSILFERVQGHLQRGFVLDTHVQPSTILKRPAFWVEIFICAVHLPPFCTFELPLSNLDYVVVYRGETIMALLNTLRIYLAWRVLTDQILTNLPRRHTVSMFASIKLGRTFAFKMLLNGWSAIAFICVMWSCSVIFAAYWFRCAEMTACLLTHTRDPSCKEPSASRWILNAQTFEKTNDLYMYSAIWIIFITSSTVGFGDIIPTTHLSRFVAGVSGLFGIVAAALLTAALSNMMAFSEAEQSASAVISREKARADLVHHAADIIGLWWRKKKGRKLTRKQMLLDRHKLLVSFRRAKRTTQTEVEDCAGMSQKIDQVASRVKYVKRAMDAISDKNWIEDEGVMQSFVEMHRQKEEEEEFAPLSPTSFALPAVLQAQNSFVAEAKSRMIQKGTSMFQSTLRVKKKINPRMLDYSFIDRAMVSASKDRKLDQKKGHAHGSSFDGEGGHQRRMHPRRISDQALLRSAAVGMG